MAVSLSKGLALCAALAVFAGQAEAKDVMRCGWYANPTPGNHWLTDADATWYLSTQGGPEAPGWMDLSPESFDFESPDRWVRVNGYYGYGCACITGQFGSPGTGDVLRVTRMKALPLSRCEADPALRRAEG